MTERVGKGRRSEDGHCGAHEQNTKDIASMKAYFAVLAISLPVTMAVIGYFVKNVGDNVTEVKQTVASSHTNTDTFQRNTEVKLARIEERLKVNK